MPVMERVTLLNSAIFFSVNCVFWLLDLWKSFPSKEVYFCLDPQQTPGWSWDVGVGKGDGNYQNFFFFFFSWFPSHPFREADFGISLCLWIRVHKRALIALSLTRSSTPPLLP